MGGEAPGTSLYDKNVLLVPGVGPERAGLLRKLGVENVFDLLFYFPYRYDDLTQVADSFADGVVLNVIGVVVGPPAVRFRDNRSTVTVPVEVHGRTLKAVFFNQPYLRHQLSNGRHLRLKGRFAQKHQSLQVSSFEIITRDITLAARNPVYRVTENLSAITLRKIIAAAMRRFIDELPDELPQVLRERFKLISLRDAVCAMHNPKNAEDLRQARRRLVFEEFLGFQLQVQGFRHVRRIQSQAPVDRDTLHAGVEALIQTLPFSLTGAQRQAIADVTEDIVEPVPMYRVLQGDVGSGKTAVAFAAIAAVSKLGMQSALMAPTGILAAQHYRDAIKLLTPLGIRVGHLTGGADAKERADVLRRLEQGTLDLVIGTHALVSADVRFAGLRLVIVDEQHRFGVGIRRMLRQKTGEADVLQLSATPIPRTLALTLYGDVAISTMRELPPGRQPVRTAVHSNKDEPVVLQTMRKELGKGRQVYVIAPRIEPGEDESDSASVIGLYERMTEELGFWTVGLVHGGMPEGERTLVMESFVDGDIQALVATSIVEVGVSVSNATAIVVYGADRFGLATLHQLRGRVGRSGHPSVCMLIADPSTPQAEERLLAMVSTQDGFVLAEKDLLLRGPGEVFGDRQSGLPTFRVGDPIRDIRIMEVARDVVQELLAAHDFWLLPAFAALRSRALEQGDALADS